MASGLASSLTEAGPWLSRSTMTRRPGSASAWKTRSRSAAWLSMYLSMLATVPIVEYVLRLRLGYVHGTAATRPPVAVAASTLVAAALFSPLRRRVQHGVDRRFNRARYDAEHTVTEFAARLQDAVDPDVVRADLAGVVHAALEPTHVSVWLGQ